MLLLGVLKLLNTYILSPGCVSIRFSLLLDWNACNEVDIHFILFEFDVTLLWETMTFYWIILGPHNGDPLRMTLLKSLSEHKTNSSFKDVITVNKEASSLWIERVTTTWTQKFYFRICHVTSYNFKSLWIGVKLLYGKNLVEEIPLTLFFISIHLFFEHLT